MKKLLLTLSGVLMLATTVLADAGDRLDACRADGSYISFIADNISEITYAKANPEDDCFAFMDILFYDGESTRLDISEYPTLKYVHSDNKFLEILRVNDEHSEVILYDCRNNEFIMSADHPEDWRAEEPGGTPHFRLKVEPGYKAKYQIVGQYTGLNYTSDPYFVFISGADSNKLLINTYSFFMPGEPVFLKAVSEELDIYASESFVGEYWGYELAAGGARLVTGDTPTLTANLLGNGSYRISSTDSHNYDLSDCFTYNSSTNRFAYVPLVFDEETSLGYSVEYAQEYGAAGQFLGDDYAFVEIHDVITDKPDNSRLYLAGRVDFNYICAFRDSYGSQALIEIIPGSGERRWFLLENNGALRREATMEFRSGTTIGEACEALVCIDGAPYKKYTLAEGGDPQFVGKGAEAGSYSAEGKPQLVLDGFGEATLGDVCGTYSISGQIVTFEGEGSSKQFLIDLTEGTYKEVTTSSKWDGAATYSNEAAYGVYSGDKPTYTNNVSVSIDYNLMGAEKPGYAAVSAGIQHNGRVYTAVADCQPYVYDAATRQLTITNVLLGLPEGGSTRKNLVLKLSEDKKSLYLEGEGCIYSTSDPGSYVKADLANALKAPDLSVPELAPRYVGEYKALSQGRELSASATLTIGKDLDGATREGYASFVVSVEGGTLISSCVPYDTGDGKLILRGVTVGDGRNGTQTVDLAFTFNEEEALLGSGTYAGASSATSSVTVDLSSGLLLPPSGQLSGDWAAKYTGSYYLASSDGEAEVANVDAVLQLNSDLSGNAKPGYAAIQVKSSAVRFVSACVEYEIEGSTLRLKDIPVKENGEEGVLSFVLDADGTLKGSGKLYSSDYGGYFYVDLSRVALEPVE